MTNAAFCYSIPPGLRTRKGLLFLFIPYFCLGQNDPAQGRRRVDINRPSSPTQRHDDLRARTSSSTHLVPADQQRAPGEPPFNPAPDTVRRASRDVFPRHLPPRLVPIGCRRSDGEALQPPVGAGLAHVPALPSSPSPGRLCAASPSAVAGVAALSPGWGCS